MAIGSAWFVIAIVAISTIGWVLTTAIRARHGYPIENEWGGTVGAASDREEKALLAENAQLKTKVERLEERLQVLERIATDPSRQLSDEIEKLRQD